MKQQASRSGGKGGGSTGKSGTSTRSSTGTAKSAKKTGATTRPKRRPRPSPAPAPSPVGTTPSARTAYTGSTTTLLTNEQALSRGKRITSRKQSHKSLRVPEVQFDDSKRAEYLSGFHRRKLERRSAAAEKKAREAREAKCEVRRDLRRQKKEELETRVAVYQAEFGLVDASDDDEDGGGGEGDGGEGRDAGKKQKLGGGGGEWMGFSDVDDSDSKDDGDNKGPGNDERRKKGTTPGLWDRVVDYEDHEKLVSVQITAL